VLSDSVAGELIASEIEIRSGRGEDFADALDRQRERRRRLFALAADLGISLGATGLHPWSRWQDQRIIDTPHYRLVEESLKYVAWRNNTFSVHAHVGVQGPDRAVAVCDALRPVLPVLLAASANSAFGEGVFTGLHSVRSEIFTRMFPRCGVPDHFGTFDAYASYVELLFEANSIVEHTQIWWSIRPHLSFGTVELRIMDAQSRADESTALLALGTACVGQADRGEPLARDPVRPRRQADRLRARRGDPGPDCGGGPARMDSRRTGGASPRSTPGAARADARLGQRRPAPMAPARDRRRRPGHLRRLRRRNL
jgi:carboxylate-amine ligase